MLNIAFIFAIDDTEVRSFFNLIGAIIRHFVPKDLATKLQYV